MNDTADLAAPLTWTMWAAVDEDHRFAPGEDPSEIVFEHFGTRIHYPQCYGCTNPVQVQLVEHAEGPYWGWLDDADEGYPSMVYRREVLFRVCFPYGPETELDRGKGRIIRLRASRCDGPS